MSSDTHVTDDEPTAVNPDEENADPTPSDGAGDGAPSSDDSSNEDTPEQKADKAQKERVLKGMVTSEADKVLKGDKTLEQVESFMREKVKSQLDSYREKLSPKDDDGDVVERVRNQMRLEDALEGLDPEEKTAAKDDYEKFLKADISPDEALAKVKKLHDILSEAEITRQEKIRAGRSHKASSKAAEAKDDSPKPQNAKEKEFAQAMQKAH